MKSIKRILAAAVSLFLVCSLAAASAATVLAPFSLQDMAVSYVYAGSAKEEAEAVFGAPLSGETSYVDATGETQELWYYDGLTLTFSEGGKLIGAEVSGETYPGPRGIELGQEPWDVISLFYLDLTLSDADVLYTSGYSDVFESQVPPCGYIRRDDDGMVSILYVAYSEPYDKDRMLGPEDFVYEDLATLIVNFDQDGTMTGFSWNRGAWAE